MTYKQAKLFMSQVEAADETSRLITKIGDWSNTPEGDEYWRAIRIKLEDKARHGTNDGKPWVDPEPPIPDGYRKAVPGDEGRADCKFWSSGGTWKRRCFVSRDFEDGMQYVVPIDRVPTDDDAKSRPEVMVRDCSDMDWEKQKLVFVNGCADAVRKFVTVDSDSQCAYEWKQARHLYLGE